MTRQPHQRTHAHALALLLAAGNIPAVLEHLNREEASLDGYSGSVWPDGLPKGSGATDPVMRLLEARYTVRTAREDLRDCIEAVCQTIDSLVYLVNQSAGVRVPREFRALPTCAFDECDQVASPHLDENTNTTIDVWCDAHWLASCRSCRVKMAEQYRTQCASCRRKSYRQESAA